MTLIVAEIEQNVIWMVGDTAVSRNANGTRCRENIPKIHAGLHFPALIAFAGDLEDGKKYSAEASKMDNPQKAMNLLQKISNNGHVHFAYAFFDKTQPKLFKIECGECVESPVLYLGSHEAFCHFQSIRNKNNSEAAPDSLKMFMHSREGLSSDRLATAILSMMDLFATRTERDVGGWAIPYIINTEKLWICQYCYSVSDPVFKTFVSGSLIEHGTPESGGFTLSCTAITGNEGIVFYILQKRAGYVFIKKPNGYWEKEFLEGSPSEFKAAGLSNLRDGNSV